jgi:hypothetical protein
MKTVATFMVPYEAHLAKGLLESEGLHALLIDEFVSDQIIYTPAIGGIRLQVLDEDYNRAREILEIGPPLAETPLSEEPPLVICPECGSSSVSTNPLSLKTASAFFVSLFIHIPVLSCPTHRVCKKCGAKW